MASRPPPRQSVPATLLAGMLCSGAQAEPVDLSFGLASATVLRGIAIGDGGVDAFAAAVYAHASGWRASLAGTALHSQTSQQRWDAQLFWRVGYAHRLHDDWSAQLAYASYSYPGSEYLRRYAHDELGATLAYRDLLYLSVAGLRRDEAGTNGNRNGMAYDIVARHPLPAALTASAGLGRVDTRGSNFAYTYGHLGLDAQWGITLAQLSYIATDSAAKRRYGEAAADRWTLSLAWHF
jgi:uncharacterized protein (TIGR02001 family)